MTGAFVALLALAACRSEPRTPPLFESLAPSATGVAFANELPENGAFGILDYLYYYDGGGVAAGDVNGDGLPDLYFTANLGKDRLYINRGGFRFEDVTDRAGVAGPPGWKTGVTMADVNGDGKLDIYVSVASLPNMRGRNALYVNDGDGTFTERAAEYGLDHAGYTTQALFFDYDRDGDLDAFLLNHATHAERSPGGDARLADDLLLRNDGGHFTDVTAAAGIHERTGFGLGIVASDVNGDGCPDLYVANDFQEDDALWINRCDGTFADSIAVAMRHTSRSSMGVDAADVDGDGRPDVISADMLPQRADVLASSANADEWSVFVARLRAGYHPQLAQNALQLNRGEGRFSEVAPLAGVEATDWSWAPLLADFDDDGRRDLFITNGIWRRPNDLDYLEQVAGSASQAALAAGDTARRRALVERMPHLAVPNAVFRNEGGLAFTEVAAAWGLAAPGFANGAAYVDLDGDGALDLVVNNVNAPASIYRNHAHERTRNHWLAVRLKGAGKNTAGIGAKVRVSVNGTHQLLEQQPTRGFQSSVDPVLHFGLGSEASVDELSVEWPDGRSSILRDVASDKVVTVDQADAKSIDYERAERPPLFADLSTKASLDFRHRENTPLDFDREPLLPHLLSTEGPALAVGDVNGDGLDDVYLGGAKWQPGALFLQRADGTFRASVQPALAADSVAEDVDAAFFDADGDGHVDLFVVSGGNEFTGQADALRDRLYLNDGRGNFRRAADALPDFFDDGACVAAGDFDGDGDVDLFVGSRNVVGGYGLTPRSRLLRNDPDTSGGGQAHAHFTDVTDELAPALGSAGMVTAATWIDYDHDGAPDLVVVGEWMPVRVFHQEGGRFVDRTREAGLAGSEGWWSAVTAADLDGDGRLDLVLGNLGRNTVLRASAKEPARLYVGDFAHDGAVQPILTTYRGGESRPVAGRDALLRANPQLRARFPTYASFAPAGLEDLFPRHDLAAGRILEAHAFSSAVALDRGNGTFVLRALPVEAQLAPVHAIVARDFDGDGKTDLLLAGNFFGVQPALGRWDASYGQLLHGRGDGSFDAVEMTSSGVSIDGEVRHMAALRSTSGSTLLVAVRNDDTPVVLQPGAGGARVARVKPSAGDARRRAR